MIDRKRVGRKSRTKGAQGERDVANALKSIYPHAARGGLLQSQYGTDSNACDVEYTPWWIEVKRGQRPNIQGAYDQATDATARGHAQGSIRLALHDDARAVHASDRSHPGISEGGGSRVSRNSRGVCVPRCRR